MIKKNKIIKDKNISMTTKIRIPKYNHIIAFLVVLYSCEKKHRTAYTFDYGLGDDY